MDPSAFDLVAQPVFVLARDENGAPCYTAFNACGCRRLGKSNEEIRGLSAKELYPGRLGEIAFANHVEAFETGTERTYEILLPIRGQQKLIRTTLKPVRASDGSVLHVIGTSLDISSTQIFREMQAEAETMQSEMEDFVSLAAHDLRAPMRNVSLIAEMLREDFRDMGDGKLELIDMLEDVGTKAMQLIGDVLTHAQASGSTRQILEFDFGDLVREVLALLDPGKDHTVHYDGGIVHGDRTATQIILRNLMENCMKHAKSSTPCCSKSAASLCLKIGLEDHNDGFFQVSVTDNGAGFDDTALLFLQGDTLRTSDSFGLLAVRRLIHGRGGRISAGSIEGSKGALVAFALPGRVRAIRTEGSPDQAAAASSTPHPTTSANEGRPPAE